MNILIFHMPIFLKDYLQENHLVKEIYLNQFTDICINLS
jgi:hypothetical protein